VTPRPSGRIPDRGDVVWLDFTPQAGHEQAGRRPGVVLSPVAYNRKVGLALVCPITTQVKGYPFEVAIPDGRVVGGVILADQVKSIDWRARRAKVVDKLDPPTVAKTLSLLRVLL
jgi:mRNA interferase MazF